jgi:hypothetical protein
LSRIKGKENPAKFELGSGDDEMTMQYRNGNDPRPPVMYAGAAGAISEEEFLPLIISFAREPAIKGMGISGGIVKVGDVEPKAGTISEIHCGLWEQEKLKEALDRVGRPGLCLGLLCTVSTVGATMECLDRGFRTPKNTHIGVHVIPEQKIDWDRLLLAHFCEDRGIVPWQSSMSLIGGLCRNAADSAVGLIANLLGQMSYAHGPMCSFFPTGLDGSWATRPCIWSVCAATRASGRNIRLATGSGTVSSYQWGQTKVGILQEAAMALLYTASGFSYSWLAGSPHEAVMLDGIMKAACTMDEERVEELAGVILNRVDELVKTEQPKAALNTFTDIYDVDTIEPLPEVVAVFNESKEELAKLGVPLN